MESKGEQGEKEREAEFITYSSGIPLDLPAFLLHLLLLRICFIYISYFSLVCPPSQFPWPPREAAIPRIRTGWPWDTNEIDRGEEGDLFSPFFFSLLPPNFNLRFHIPFPPILPRWISRISGRIFWKIRSWRRFEWAGSFDGIKATTLCFARLIERGAPMFNSKYSWLLLRRLFTLLLVDGGIKKRANKLENLC